MIDGAAQPGSGWPIQVAVSVFSKIVVEQAGNLKQVVLSLRILGVYVCALIGCPEKCPCWKALVKRYDIESARKHLKVGLGDALAA